MRMASVHESSWRHGIYNETIAHILFCGNLTYNLRPNGDVYWANQRI